LTLNGFILKNTGMHQHAVFLTTALASGIFTWLMGLLVNLPVVLGPSLALNVLFAQISTRCDANEAGTATQSTDIDCPGWGESSLPWTDTMGAVFLSGWFYLFFTFAGIRGYLYAMIPSSLRASIAVGTGFFITMVGLKIGHITRVTVLGENLPKLLSAAGCTASDDYNFDCTAQRSVSLEANWYLNGIAHFQFNPYARIAVLGIVFAVALEMIKVRGSLIISIWLATFVGINFYNCKSSWKPEQGDDSIHECVTDLSIWSGHPVNIPFIANHHNTTAGMLSFKFANKPFFWQTVFTFLFFELYDSFGALTGIVTRMGDCRNHPTVAVDRVNRAMVVDGLGVWLGSIIGCNSIAVYIESNTGVEVGARTGLAAIVCGSLLLLCLLFVYPFVYIIPACATTCALVIVGMNTIQEYKRIDTGDYIHLFSGFLTIAFMGFTYSITNGICAGVISYTWLQFVCFLTGQAQEKLGAWWPSFLKIRPDVSQEMPHPALIITAAFMAARFSLLLQQ
jgi:AGZA family xanthine/uracil permease-like MFS transporter